jgi:hypothetical protein
MKIDALPEPINAMAKNLGDRDRRNWWITSGLSAIFNERAEDVAFWSV